MAADAERTPGARQCARRRQPPLLFATRATLLLGVAGGSLALALALACSSSWSVVAPLRRTQERLSKIAGGDFAEHVEVPNRDEIGALAADVNRMNDELRRLYGELETASRHKSDFLATMSHELRTPLNAIIGFTEVLHEQMFGELNERQLAYVDDVLEAGRHLLSLINDVLDLAKIEAGRMELDLSQVALPDLLRSAVSMHSERAGRGGIALALTTEPAEISITADERRVRQIVFNLLSNAIKFTPSGRPRRHLRPTPKTAGSRSRSPTPAPASRRPTSRRSSRSSSRPPTASRPRAPASGFPSPASSSSCTAASSGSRARSAAAAPSASPCPPTRRPQADGQSRRLRSKAASRRRSDRFRRRRGAPATAARRKAAARLRLGRNAARGRVLPGHSSHSASRTHAATSCSGCSGGPSCLQTRPDRRHAAQASDRVPHQRAGRAEIQGGVRLGTRPDDRERHGTALRRLGPQVLLRGAQLRFIPPCRASIRKRSSCSRPACRSSIRSSTRTLAGVGVVAIDPSAHRQIRDLLRGAWSAPMHARPAPAQTRSSPPTGARSRARAIS